MSCFLAFKGGCRGLITEGGHCQHHLGWARERALLSPEYERCTRDSIDEAMLADNGTGYRYQRPEHVWQTQKGALRRPSHVLDGKKPEFEQGFGALDPVAADFLREGGWDIYEIPTGEPPGRRKSGIMDEDVLIDAINDYLAQDVERLARVRKLTDPTSGHLNRLELSALRKELLAGIPRDEINTQAVTNLFGLAGRRSARNLLRPPNPPKYEGIPMDDRIANIETQLNQIYAAVDETLQLVRGRFPDDARVKAAVEDFIAVALRDEHAA